VQAFHVGSGVLSAVAGVRAALFHDNVRAYVCVCGKLLQPCKQAAARHCCGKGWSLLHTLIVVAVCRCRIFLETSCCDTELLRICFRAVPDSAYDTLSLLSGHLHQVVPTPQAMGSQSRCRQASLPQTLPAFCLLAAALYVSQQ
jgi:hypothetical protein